jgi:hypothetical protein
MSHPSEPDPSRLEAAEAGAFHERAEADAGVVPRPHVGAEELAPDALAQHANADVAPPEPAERFSLAVASVVAVAVVLAIVAIAVAIVGS